MPNIQLATPKYETICSTKLPNLPANPYILSTAVSTYFDPWLAQIQL